MRKRKNCLLCKPKFASHFLRVCHSNSRFGIFYGIKGYEVETVLRNGYPFDRNDFLGTTVNKIEIIDDVKYHFNSKESSKPHQLPRSV